MKKTQANWFWMKSFGLLMGMLGSGPVAEAAFLQDSVLLDSARVSQIELSKGRIIKASGKLMEAYQLYEGLVKQQPGNYDALFEMAVIARELKANQFVIPHLQQALELSPKNGKILNYYLEYARANGDAENATKALVGLHAAFPDEESYYFDLAYIYFYQKKQDAAWELLSSAENRFGLSEKLLDAQSRFLEEDGKINEAIQVLEKWDQLENPSINGYMMRSEFLGKQKRYKEALVLLDQTQQRFPKQSAMLNLSRSDIYRFQGDHKNALSELENAFRSDQLDLQTQSSVLYSAVELLPKDDLNQLAKVFGSNFEGNIQKDMVLGDIYAQSQQFAQALHAYQAALKVNPKLSAVWDQVLNIHLFTGNYSAVIQDGEMAMSNFPQIAKYKFFVGNAYFLDQKQSEEERFKQARFFLESALNTENPEDSTMMSDIYSTLGDVYNSMKMYAESDVAYEEALATNPDNVHALNNYAYYLALRKEKLDQAVQYSEKVLKFEPENPTNLDTHAWVLYQIGDYKNALVFIEKALKSSKNPSVTVLEHSGDIHFQLGNKKEALKRWKKALKIAESQGEMSDELVNKVKNKKLVSDL